MTTHRRPPSASLVVIVLAALMSNLCLSRLAGAATITVGPGCTLRDAIASANTDTAVGSCAAGSGADVIDLPFGIYLMDAPHDG